MFSWYSARLGRRIFPSRSLFSTRPFNSLHAIQTESLQLNIKYVIICKNDAEQWCKKHLFVELNKVCF